MDASSVQYKSYLKWLFVIHSMVLVAMWIKVGGEFVVRELGVKWTFYSSLDLPSAYPWEYIWSLSFLPVVFALSSFQRNKVGSFSRGSEVYKELSSLYFFGGLTHRSFTIWERRVWISTRVVFWVGRWYFLYVVMVFIQFRGFAASWLPSGVHIREMSEPWLLNPSAIWVYWVIRPP